MLLERVLNVLVISGWLLLFAFIVQFFISSTKREGFASALKKMFRSSTILTILFVVATISMINSSLVFIEPQEVGVVISLTSPNGYRSRPLRSGLHWIVPMAEEVHTYPIFWQTYTMASKPNEGAQMGDDSIVARTSDGQEVIIDCSVIFQIDPDEAPQIYISWQERYIEDLIRPTIRSLVRSYVSQYKVDEVNSSKRLDLERDLTTELETVLSDGGFIMADFLLRNITFSKEYATAVEGKQVALQDAIKKEYEAEQIQKLAEGEAARILTLAEAEAQAIQLLGESLMGNPDVITLRYVDKLSPNVQVMLVPSDSPFLLTMPGLIPDSNTSAGNIQNPVEAGVPEEILNEILASPTPTLEAMPSPTPTTTPVP